MGAWTFPLVFVCLCLKVILTEASSWSVTMPSSIKGLPGSCVVIPCSYNYPDPGKRVTEFTGIWTDSTGRVIYHHVNSKIMPEYKTRTELMGDITQGSCSLKIDPLQQSDQGPFHFRIEIGGYNKYSYKEKQVSITMISAPQPTVSVKEEIVEGQTVSASCSVSYSCPPSPPQFTWNHSGKMHFQSQQLSDGQWKATSSLTFQPTTADHNKSLLCIVKYKGGLLQEKASNVLKVKYAPLNVKVDYKSHVKEGESVELKCSSEANPPANSYKWHNETGALLHQGESYMLRNVSRHIGALYCTAINTVGQNKSSPVEFSVSFAPQIKNLSCSSEDNKVKCVCTVESNPPSMVHFVLSDRVPPRTKTETDGLVIIGTLEAESASSEFVHCLANNTQGNVNLTFTLPVKGKIHNVYIFIAIGTGVCLMMLLITLGVVRKRRRRFRAEALSEVRGTHGEKAVELPHFASTKSKEMDYDDPHCHGIYSNDHVYGNMQNDWDEAIYANM